MTHSFKLSRRIARLRAPVLGAIVLTFLGCNSSDSLTSESTSPTGVVDAGPEAAPAPSLGAGSFAGGIPMGTFAMPTTEFGSVYNGALRNIRPHNLINELTAIRARGGKIVLMMAGSQPNYLNRDGTFSLEKWKARVAEYRNVNFSSFINDGTIIAHYLIDEPYDAANFSGRAVSGGTIEEMARYSKSFWPNLKTIVRAEPYLIKWSGRYQALDAAWAQYLSRKGNVNSYLQQNVSAAKQMGLGLVVGLNILKGGTPNGSWMTASEIENYGSALLNSDYACAFISWQHNSKLESSDMRNAMTKLRRKAESLRSRTCSAS